MTWDELLERFRALGGEASNIRLGDGARGRGIFVIDRSRPATLYTPASLFIPEDDIIVTGRQMTVRPQAPVSSETREFFDLYQRHFGWGNGGFDFYWSQQASWHALDAELIAAVREMATPGVGAPPWRFDAPTTAICLEAYVSERHFTVEGRRYLVPLIDLVNHSGFADGFEMNGGVGISGTFADEMLVCYNGGDAWAHMMNYGFASESATGCSLAITLTLSDGRQLAFERSVATAFSGDRFGIPKPRTNGALTTFPFVTLGFTKAMDVPRTAFRQILAPFMDIPQADWLFDRLHHFNRMRFIELLRTLRKHDGAHVRELENAALYQLEALSAAVGPPM
jgi:hypothetical protein